MLYTLAQAREAVKRFVDNGSCNNAVIDARINEALERLTDHADFECMRATVKISTCNHCFTLPYNVEKLLFADVNGTPAKILGQAYQFLSSGPGDLDYKNWGSGFQDIVDQGEHPTQFTIPTSYTTSDGTEVGLSSLGLHLAAFSTEKEDVGQLMTIRGFKGSCNGDEVHAGQTPGEDLPIQRWAGGVEGKLSGFWNLQLTHSVDRFKDVTEIIKPETKGYVTLYGVVGDNSPAATNATFFAFLAKFHPRQTIPQFRRYGITNAACGCQACILAHVKMRHVPLVDGNDILPIDSLQALKLMVMALKEENAGNLAGAEVFEGKALAVMLNRERSRTQSDGVPVIYNTDYRLSLGRKMNKGRMLV